MTPKEAAALGVEKIPEVKKFLYNDATPAELLEFLHDSNYPMWREDARDQLNFRLADGLARQTDKLIVFTNSLRWLTIVLIVIAGFQVIFQIVDFFSKSH